ncbi:MAG: DUF4886 domain-containing protein, partial [Myxococcota bacterium]
IAPVGRAFLKARSDAPEIKLFGPDGEHPSRRGSYLAACVLYSVLTGSSPVGLDYAPPKVPRAHALTLQQIAWDAVTPFAR